MQQDGRISNQDLADRIGLSPSPCLRRVRALEEAGVYASTGSACSSKKRHVSAVLTAMGIPADRAEWALRFSLCPYTTEEEIDYAAKVAGEKYEILKKFQRR